MVALISRTPQARIIAPSVSDAGGNRRRRAKQKGRWRTVTGSCANAAGGEKEIGIGLVQLLLFAQRTLGSRATANLDDTVLHAPHAVAELAPHLAAPPWWRPTFTI